MKRSTKSLSSIVIAGTILVTGLTSAIPAQAATPPPAEYASAQAFLNQYGVPLATQIKLIKTAEAGGKWDSLSSASKVVASRSYTQQDGTYTVKTYEDGSISVVRIENPTVGALSPAVASPDAITGCTNNSGAHTGCKIDMWVGTVALDFYANFNTNNNTVTKVYSPGWSIAGSCSTSLIDLIRPAANIGREDVSAQMCVVGYSTTFFLQLKVSGGVPTESWDS
ncbi:MAG TPA: hypothetical protein VGF80_01540 [Galbitalea sp.]|jgi:hypothetical protein